MFTAHETAQGSEGAKPVEVMSSHPLTVNLSKQERTVSLVAGLAAAVVGVANSRWYRLGAVATGLGLMLRGLTGHCPLYEWLGVHPGAEDNPLRTDHTQHRVKYETAVHILLPPEELYRLCREGRQLPHVTTHLVSVSADGKGRSQWVARSPGEHLVHWDVKLLHDQPNARLMWRTVAGSDLKFTACIRFEVGPDGHGTIVVFSLSYEPPLGNRAVAANDCFSIGLEHLLDEELERFKELLEADGAGRCESAKPTR